MSDQRVYLDDIYASKESEGSVFRAVVMMAQEARFINQQSIDGFINLEKKPTTIAMYKFKEGRLAVSEKSSTRAKASEFEQVAVEQEQVVPQEEIAEAPLEVSDAAAADLF